MARKRSVVPKGHLQTQVNRLVQFIKEHHGIDYMVEEPVARGKLIDALWKKHIDPLRSTLHKDHREDWLNLCRFLFNRGGKITPAISNHIKQVTMVKKEEVTH